MKKVPAPINGRLSNSLKGLKMGQQPPIARYNVGIQVDLAS